MNTVYTIMLHKSAKVNKNPVSKTQNEIYPLEMQQHVLIKLGNRTESKISKNENENLSRKLRREPKTL